MTQEEQIIVNMIIDILGEPIKENDDALQYAFNCPVCDEGRNKANLEVNVSKQVYHCWSCDSEGPSDYSKGSLRRFFEVYGNERHQKLYSVFRPAKRVIEEPEAKPVELPDGFITFDKINIDYPPHIQAINYLKSRGVTREMVIKYRLGLTTNGKFARRIIFPSYDKDNKLNFFVGRTWVSDKPKYLGYDTPKDNIIFNENLLDWDKDIYIVEGPFDALFVENSIVTLGSHLSRYKIEQIYSNAKANVIIGLDPDAKNKAQKLYRDLNGGRLWNKIKMLSLPEGEDIASLHGDVEKYITTMR